MCVMSVSYHFPVRSSSPPDKTTYVPVPTQREGRESRGTAAPRKVLPANRVSSSYSRKGKNRVEAERFGQETQKNRGFVGTGGAQGNRGFVGTGDQEAQRNSEFVGAGGGQGCEKQVQASCFTPQKSLRRSPPPVVQTEVRRYFTFLETQFQCSCILCACM